jgi:hypothetical protein
VELRNLCSSPNIIRVIKLRGMRRSTHGEKWEMFTFWSRNLSYRDHSDDAGVDGRLILNLTLNVVWGCGLDLAGSGLDSEAGCCEHGNEYSGSLKDWEFCDNMSDCQLLENSASISYVRSIDRSATIKFYHKFLKVCVLCWEIIRPVSK